MIISIIRLQSYLILNAFVLYINVFYIACFFALIFMLLTLVFINWLYNFQQDTLDHKIQYLSSPDGP